MFYEFELTYIDPYTAGKETTTVAEPRNFSEAFSSKLERDIDYHGVFFQLSDENISLDFADGRAIFKQAYEGDGFDALVTVRIGRKNKITDPFETIYTGRAIMEEIDFNREYALVTFQEFNALIDINNNKALEVDSTSTEDVNGNAITAPTLESVELRGRDIRAVWGLSSETGGILTSVNTVTGTDLTTVPNELDLLGQEIEYNGGQKGYRLSQFAQGNDSSFPSRYFVGGQLLVRSDGFYPDAEIRVNGDFTKTEVGTYTSGGVTLYLVEILVDPDGVDATTYTYTEIQRVDTGDPDGSYSLTQTISPVGGKNKYVGLSLEADLVIVAGVQFDVDFGLDECTLTAETSYPSRNAEAYKFFDVLAHNIEVITGENLLRSSYLDQGTLDLLYESNGWKIRGFDNVSVGTFQDRMRTLKSCFNLGYGFEEDKYTDSDAIRVEPMEYFYRDELLIDFPQIEGDSYNESVSEKFKFNKVVLGFDKSSTEEDQPGTTEDLHTMAQIKAPVNQLQSEYIWTSPHIGSDIAIELIRRKDNRRRPNEKTKFDDDLFLLDCIDDSGLKLARPPENSLYTVGITNSDTAANMRFNLRFAYYNHGITTNTVTQGKGGTSVYTVPKYENARGLEKKIGYTGSATDTTLGDSTQYGSPLSVPDLDANTEIQAFTTLLRPNVITFRVGLTNDQLQLILDAHKNKADSGNYGYIQITNPRGEIKSGWVLSMIYTEIDKIAEFNLIERN